MIFEVRVPGMVEEYRGTNEVSFRDSWILITQNVVSHQMIILGIRLRIRHNINLAFISNLDHNNIARQTLWMKVATSLILDHSSFGDLVPKKIPSHTA